MATFAIHSAKQPNLLYPELKIQPLELHSQLMFHLQAEFRGKFSPSLFANETLAFELYKAMHECIVEYHKHIDASFDAKLQMTFNQGYERGHAEGVAEARKAYQAAERAKSYLPTLLERTST